MKKIAIIPARGGSKRIPRKNIKLFHGKPMIAYAIESALKSNLFDRVIVSTEDLEIAEIAQKYGAEVPFMRSEKNSDDFASTADVLIEVLSNLDSTNDDSFVACCLYPTSPLVNYKDLRDASLYFDSNNFDAIFAVQKYSSPIQRAFILDTEMKIKPLYPENVNVRTQELEPVFHDAGSFYFFRTSYLIINKTLWSKNSGAFILDELKVQDIDNENDWKLAELKYELLQNIK